LKKAVIYLLTLAYLFVQMKPLTAVFCDLTAHIFFKASHMATVHYENGHYHLHAELEQSAKEQKDERSSLPDKQEYKEIQQILQENFRFFISSNQSSAVIHLQAFVLSEGHINASSRPPEAA
jgi:hypothetical protein